MKIIRAENNVYCPFDLLKEKVFYREGPGR